jgi:hypothetical protein
MVTPRKLVLALSFSLAILLAIAAKIAAVPRPSTDVSSDTASLVMSPDSLPPLPDSIISARGWTKVHRAPGPLDCGGATDAVGCYTYPTRTLVVATGLSRGEEWVTFEHEKIHMILGDAGLRSGERDDDDPYIDDKIAETIAEYQAYARLLDPAAL